MDVECEREAVQRFLRWLDEDSWGAGYALAERRTDDGGGDGWAAEPWTARRCLALYDLWRQQQHLPALALA